jgi:hypothetical protein
MSNLQSAKSAIQAEIAHARQGLAFYQSRIETLEQTLDQLDTVSTPEDIAEQSEGRRRQPVTQTRAGRKPGRPARATRASSKGSGLPQTGGEFWMQLISDQPQSAAELLKQAIAHLGSNLDKKDLQKLRQRVSPALQALLKSNRIKDTGAGRERRYFKG